MAEIGCGNGYLLKELATIWKDTKFLGIDPSINDQKLKEFDLKFENSTLDDFIKMKENLICILC